MEDSRYIISQNESKERDLIIKLSKKGNTLRNEHFLLERLKVSFSESILESDGQYFDVKPGKRDKRTHKSGNCYRNAFNMMKKGFGYVEGLVYEELNNREISHAWNVDKNGNHIDFSVDKNDGVEYFGIILPENIVWDVGLHNGGITYCVLPFIEIKM